MVIGIVTSWAADFENRFAVPVVGRIQSGYVHTFILYLTMFCIRRLYIDMNTYKYVYI